MPIKPTIMKLFACFFSLLLLSACGPATSGQGDARGIAQLTEAEMENLVKVSFQYVALYNVTNKFAMAQGGWNTVEADTSLKDHTMTDIARPNNDTYYTSALLDLRKEPIILNLPVFGSAYSSLMVTAYDHYVNVPKSTRKGDFAKPELMLFYSDRTENYDGEPVEGIDQTFKSDGDFISAIFRTMPHIAEPERYAQVKEAMASVRIQTLSEYLGGTALPRDPIDFPEVGETNLDVFENNLLEVMQFVMNHVTFDPGDPMDQQVLAAYAPLGIEPGGTYDPKTGPRIDGKRMRAVAQRVQQEYLALLGDPDGVTRFASRMLRAKGETDLEAVLLVSIVGPIGLPMEEAMYPSIAATGGSTMNAQHDYVISMSKSELPPAKAFWSMTLYDSETGFFIPNDRKKYSVGLNGGMALNPQGGIDIYIAAERPEGVPPENWLPIQRKDQDLDVILRIYVPDLEAMKTWKAPVARPINEKS